MRLFLDLLVDRKLAASAALAVGLLILLAVLVRGQAAAVAEAGGRDNADVQFIAAAAEEMAARVAEIARRVQEAAEVAAPAVTEAGQTDATLQGLSDAASRIGDVVRLIGDIAGQTNLLEPNATIKAARAGEAGKGFAVVMGEVKLLANQTAKAKEDIARQIVEMQGVTGQAVEAICSIGAVMAHTSEIATSSAAAMRDDGDALATPAATLREKSASFLAAVRATAVLPGPRWAG